VSKQLFFIAIWSFLELITGASGFAGSAGSSGSAGYTGSGVSNCGADPLSRAPGVRMTVVKQTRSNYITAAGAVFLWFVYQPMAEQMTGERLRIDYTEFRRIPSREIMGKCFFCIWEFLEKSLKHRMHPKCSSRHQLPPK
jgi:hypothetical protein